MAAAIWCAFGKACVGLFANCKNAQCQLWSSLSAREEPPLRVDTFAHQPWPRSLLYALTVVLLLPCLLDRFQEKGLAVITVTLWRMGAAWFPCLHRLAVCPPLEMPCRRDALSQAMRTQGVPAGG